MTEEDKSTPRLWAVVRAEADYDSAEEALESIVQLKEVEFEGAFTDRSTELDSDDGEGISISFEHENEHNWLSLATDPDNQLQVGLSLVNDHSQYTNTILDKILDHVPPLTLNSLTVVKKYETSFKSLAIPISEDWEPDITGVRVKYDGIDYIIQETDDDATSITASKEPNTELSAPIEDDFMNEHIQRVDGFMDEVL